MKQGVKNMRVLVDTNVILDTLLQRPNLFEHSKKSCTVLSFFNSRNNRGTFFFGYVLCTS